MLQPQSGLSGSAHVGSADVDRELQRLLRLPDEAGIDPRWTAAHERVIGYALRPAKRVRPALLIAGYNLASGRPATDEVVRFAAALELLHTFVLIHDDVADRAESRRGGPALHHLLGSGRHGEELAVIAGDHLFARAVEAMLETDLPAAPSAVAWLLAVCRQTAAGQFLDLSLARAPLGEVTLFQLLRVAHLKTARYGFVAPLVCGAMLGGGTEEQIATLERIGRQAGLAFQLRDDLLGLFGDSTQCGKAGDADFREGKRTFPLLAAWTRADAAGRRRLARLWGLEQKDAEATALARAEIERWGGRAATERVIERSTRQARRALASLPASEVTAQLDGLIEALARRRT